MGVLKNQRHELFSQNIAVGLGKQDAAIEAGYSPNSAAAQATRLLKNAKIKARIQELQARSATNVVLTKSWVLEKLVAVHDAAIEGQPVLDRYGKPTGATLKNLSAANRALELIGKSDGINCFTEKSETTHRDGGEIAQMMRDMAGRSRHLPPGPVIEKAGKEPADDKATKFAQTALVEGANGTNH